MKTFNQQVTQIALNLRMRHFTFSILNKVTFTQTIQALILNITSL